VSELERLQSMFAQGLRAGTPGHADLGELAAASDPTGFEQRFEVYRNNAWQFFQSALERTFPVLRRRVGPEFFRQLAREYREVHPSGSGDLHWVGERFPAWLVGHLGGSGYEWLADLARLEWACEDAAVASSAAPVELADLSQFEAGQLPLLQLQWQASLRRVPSTFPVFSVWHANQGDAEPETVDLSRGAEHCVVACAVERVVVYRLEPVDFDLLGALVDGQSLGAAIDSTGTDPEQLARFLAWAFGEGLVTGVSAPALD
jgi:hypothetical protein